MTKLSGEASVEVPPLTKALDMINKAVAAVVCMLVGLAPAQASACRYHGLGNGISQQAPGSIDVAIALRQGVVDGLLDHELVSPNFKKDIFGTGYRRAVRHLQDLRLVLEQARAEHDDPTPFSVILVEATLWSRYVPSAKGETLSVHQLGAVPGDPIVVTSEAVIEALSVGRLSIDDAFQRNLIVIFSGEKQRDSTNALLRQAFASLQKPRL